MSHTGKTPWPQLALGCALAALAVAAHADVTMQERLRVSGLISLANMNGTTTTMIAGDRARTDSNLQFESGLMRTFAGGLGQSSEIVRLDQDKIYSLDPKKKTYTEMTFADQRARMQSAMQKTQESQQQQQQQASGVDESQCEWSEPKADVKRTGEKATIAGYEAERVSITATQSCKDKKTGQVCDFGLLLDEWVAPGFQQSAEALAYHRAYAEKLGFGTPGSRDFAERAQSMFGRYKGIWTEIAEKMKDVQGYPMKASFGLGVGGPQCQKSEQQQSSQSQDQGSSGAASSPPPTSIGGALGGALGGLFKKKSAEPAASATPPAEMPGGLIPLMTIGTELVSVTSGAVNPQMFEVPGDYKKKTE